MTTERGGETVSKAEQRRLAEQQRREATARPADSAATVSVGGEGEGVRAATEAEAAAERARNQAQAAAAQIQAARAAQERARADEARARAFAAAKQESIRVDVADRAKAERAEIERQRSAADLTSKEQVDELNRRIEEFNERFREGGSEIAAAQQALDASATEATRRIEAAYEPAQARVERANRTVDTANRLAREANEAAAKGVRQANGREFANSLVVARGLADVQVNEAEVLLKSTEVKADNELRDRIERLQATARRVEQAESADIDDLSNPDSAAFKQAQAAYERYTQDAAALNAVLLETASEIQKKRVDQLINAPGTDEETIRRLKERNEAARDAVRSVESKWRVLARGLSSVLGPQPPATKQQARAEGQFALETADRVLSAPGQAVKRAVVPIAVPGGPGAAGLGASNTILVRPFDYTDTREGIANWIEANAGSPGAATVFRLAAPDNPLDIYLFVTAAGQLATLSYRGSKLLIKGYGETALKAEDAAVAAAKAIRESAGAAPALAKQMAAAPLVGLQAERAAVRVGVRIAERPTIITIIDPQEGKVLIRGSEAATPLRESARAVQLEGSRLTSRLPPAERAKVAKEIDAATPPLSKTDNDLFGGFVSSEAGGEAQFTRIQAAEEQIAARRVAGTISESQERELLSRAFGFELNEQQMARIVGPRPETLVQRRDAALTRGGLTERQREILLGQKAAQTVTEREMTREIFGFDVEPTAARDALRAAARSEIESITRGGKTLFRAPEQSDVERERERLAALKLDLQQQITRLQVEREKVPATLKQELARTGIELKRLEKLSIDEVAVVSVKGAEKPLEKIGPVESREELPIKEPGPTEKPREVPRQVENPVEVERPAKSEEPEKVEDPTATPGEDPVAPPPDAPPGDRPPPGEPPPSRTPPPGESPPPGKRPRRPIIPVSRTTYDPPAEDEAPTQVVFRRGVVEQRKNIVTGKREFGRDLSPEVPNNPRISPSESLHIERFGKLGRRFGVFDAGLFSGVIDTREKTISFVLKAQTRAYLAQIGATAENTVARGSVKVNGEKPKATKEGTLGRGGRTGLVSSEGSRRRGLVRGR